MLWTWPCETDRRAAGKTLRIVRMGGIELAVIDDLAERAATEPRSDPGRPGADRRSAMIWRWVMLVAEMPRVVEARLSRSWVLPPSGPVGTMGVFWRALRLAMKYWGVWT